MPLYPGSTVDIDIEVADPKSPDTLVDPAAVSVVVHAPDGTASNPSATRTATGTYTVGLIADQVGLWKAIITTTGTYAGKLPIVFNVEPLPF